jgi:hypothetical protein
MDEIYVTTRREWREWLSENHNHVSQGIWLVYYRKQFAKPSLGYEESVEGALLWLD